MFVGNNQLLFGKVSVELTSIIGDILPKPLVRELFL